MPASTRAARAVALLFLAVAVILPARAFAQQNPFVGTWSTSMMLPNGTGGASYVDFNPNYTFHMSALASGSGQVWHFCGTYRLIGSTLETVFTGYSPHLCAGGICELDPVPLNRPLTVQYQFPNANLILLSDGTRYVRQPSNPFPLPPNGCN